MILDVVKDAARRRAKRGAPERKRLASYKRIIQDIESIAHHGRAPVATGQTLARMTESPLARMKRTRKLNIYEVCAADEILSAFRISAGEASCRDRDLGVGFQDMRPDAADSVAAGRIDAVKKFGQWKKDLAKTPALAAVTAILLDERSIRSTEQEHHWRHGAAKKHLIDGLRHFAALRGNTPRGVHDWRYQRTTKGV